MYELILFVILIISGLYYFMYLKISFIEERSASKRLNAKVIFYRKEKGPMRNDSTRIEYPYVKIGDDPEAIPRRLRFANNWGRHFKIGEEIEVFWNGLDLVYWNAYDKGLYKYLPNKWKFWQKDLL